MPLSPLKLPSKIELKEKELLVKLATAVIAAHKNFDKKVEEVFARLGETKRGPQGISIRGASVNEDAIVEKILAQLPKVRNGKDADQDQIIQSILDRLPKPEKVVIDHDALAESVKGKLGMAHVSNFEEEVKKINDKHYKPYIHGGGDTIAAGTNVTITTVNGRKVINASGSGGGGNFIYNETPSGSGTTFMLTQTPVTGSLQLFRNGQLIIGGGTDYTLSGTTVTLVTTLDAVNENLRAWYQY